MSSLFGSDGEDETPPWMSDDKLAPLFESYEARIRELKLQNGAQTKTAIELRSKLEELVQV